MCPGKKKLMNAERREWSVKPTNEVIVATTELFTNKITQTRDKLQSDKDASFLTKYKEIYNQEM